MSLQFMITVTLNGLTLAALYFIVASGFSLIFGLMRTVNMAHGSLYLIGAYVGFAVFDSLYASNATAGYAWYAGLLAGVAAAAVAGVVMQVVFLGWMQGQELRQALVTIGLSIIIADQLLAHFGGNPFQFFAPDALFGPTPVPVIGRYSTFRLFQIGLALAVGVGLWLLLNKTRLGIMVRAGVDDSSCVIPERGFDCDGNQIGSADASGITQFVGTPGVRLAPPEDGGKHAVVSLPDDYTIGFKITPSTEVQDVSTSTVGHHAVV